MSKKVATAMVDRPICPKCGSKEVRHRIRTNDYWCRRCGNIFPKDKQ